MPDFVVFDIETTGLYGKGNDRIIEIATVVLDSDLDVVERWETLICPERDVGPSHIHGITAADVANAPTFQDLAGDIWHRFEGAIPVSHNLMFDSRFLLAEFARSGFKLGNFEGICTLDWAFAK
jgi:DNA polymerase-3 subunit epsilon